MAIYVQFQSDGALVVAARSTCADAERSRARDVAKSGGPVIGCLVHFLTRLRVL